MNAYINLSLISVFIQTKDHSQQRPIGIQIAMFCDIFLSSMMILCIYFKIFWNCKKSHISQGVVQSCCTLTEALCLSLPAPDN